jgi:NMD protein affecting ribosome stability and mRNA decay
VSAARRCPSCGRSFDRYPGEEKARDYCWSCWVERFPTPQAREAELARRGKPASLPTPSPKEAM